MTTAASVRDLPLPPEARGGLPWVGPMLDYARDPLGVSQRLARELGDVVLVRGVGEHFVLLAHPEHIAAVLTTYNGVCRKDAWTRLMSELLGDGLLTSEGATWKAHRRLANPAFKPGRIAGYAATMVRRTQDMTRRWRDGADVDAHDEMMRLTLDIVAETLFGAAISDNEARRVGEAIALYMQAYLGVFRTGWRPPAWIPTPLNRQLPPAMADLDGIIHRLIRDHRQTGTADDAHLLAMLAGAVDEDGTRLSDKELRDEALTLLAAGHETTAIALGMTLWLLATHPAIEATLHREVDAVLAGRPATLEDVTKLTYTRQVVTEAMRLYPPAWAIGRETMEDIALGGYRIPAKSQLFISQWVVHRDPRWYSAPDWFRPERWAPDAGRSRPKYAYFPFGGGARICIGKRFAEMELVLCLATIAQRWRLRRRRATVKLMPSITIRPVGGLPMRLEAR